MLGFNIGPLDEVCHTGDVYENVYRSLVTLNAKIMIMGSVGQILGLQMFDNRQINYVGNFDKSIVVLTPEMGDSGHIINDPLATLRCLTPGGANRLVVILQWRCNPFSRSEQIMVC